MGKYDRRFIVAVSFVMAVIGLLSFRSGEYAVRSAHAVMIVVWVAIGILCCLSEFK